MILDQEIFQFIEELNNPSVKESKNFLSRLFGGGIADPALADVIKEKIDAIASKGFLSPEAAERIKNLPSKDLLKTHEQLIKLMKAKGLNLK